MQVHVQVELMLTQQPKFAKTVNLLVQHAHSAN